MSAKNGYAAKNSRKWPIAAGRYVVGDPESSVAICTLASELDVDLTFAIKGSCTTENLGIEKVIVNIISNPNIRFLILCGSEVAGHKTGKCFKALKEFGVDPRSRRIIQAPGPIPILGNLPSEAIERFRKQVEIVDLIGVEDLNEIRRALYKCLKKEVKPYPDLPYIVKLEGEVTRSAFYSQDITVLPEYGIGLDTFTGLLG